MKKMWDRLKVFWTQLKTDSKPQYKKFIVAIWAMAVLPLMGAAFLLTLIAMGAFGDMPTFEDLENPKSNLAAEIYSSDGALLGKFYRENRTTVDFDDISPNLINALVATEDERYYAHSGVDVIALGRVVKGIVSGDMQGGGSTISQQLAKNLFPRDTTRNRSFLSKVSKLGFTKFKEWVTAVKLERRYAKNEIIVMYLNTVHFGHNSYGIKSASRIYFNTTPDKVTVEQAAVLVGMLKASTAYNPKTNPDRSFKRRNVVMFQMKKNGFLSQTQYDSLKVLPLDLHFRSQTHNDGLATYFREYLRTNMQKNKPQKDEYNSIRKYREDSTKWADDALYGWCYKNPKPDGSPRDLYRDGLRIHTTLDSRMQQYAEKAVSEHMAGYLQPAFFKHKKNNKKAPFAWDTSDKMVDKILYNAMRWSERYRVLSNLGLDSAQIRRNFETPTQMLVFKWRDKINPEEPYSEYWEEVDTLMSPLDSIRYYKYFLHPGFMAMDPVSGHVKAYVGGMNFNHFQFDHINTGRRQVGSTFKPIIYTLAMLNGYNPCTEVLNISYTFDKMPEGQKPYTPQYSKSKREGELITLKYGLASSLNQISAWVLRQYNPEDAVRLARLMGIKSPIDAVPSLCVGSAEIYVSEMMSAYSTFANKGFYTEPIYVTSIEDRNGNEISRFKTRNKQVMSEETAFMMLELMQGVVNYGTSTRLRTRYKITNPIAGKTGTTNDNSDGWFIGIVPNLVAGAWVGGEDRQVHFDSTDLGQGANMALPIWGLFMQQVYADPRLHISKERFQAPASDPDMKFDCSKDEKAEDWDDLFGGSSL